MTENINTWKEEEKKMTQRQSSENAITFTLQEQKKKEKNLKLLFWEEILQVLS